MTGAFERPVFARLRRVCLALPEAAETASWGHPNFRAGKKAFCTFEIVSGRPSIAFRLPSAEVARMARRRHFFATPYGRGVWVSAWVDVAIDWTEMATLLERSYRQVANKRTLRVLDSTPKESSAAIRTLTRGENRS